MALLQRLLNVTFGLTSGTFTDSGSNSLTLTGLRIHADAHFPGGSDMNSLHAEIYGMTLSQMNDLMTYGAIPQNTGKNTVTLTAGDAVNGMSQVFSGTIVNAWGDFQSAPEVVLHVQGSGGTNPAVAATPPTSSAGSVSIPTLMQQVAGAAGMQFENNGVTGMLSNPYYPGTAREQLLAMVKDVGCEWNAMENNVVSIWPVDGSRAGGVTTQVNKDTCMVGYPLFNANGIVVKTLYTPSIKFGTLIQVTSDLTGSQTSGNVTVGGGTSGANGTWKVMSIDYDLDSLVFGGQWFSTLFASLPGYVPTLTPAAGVGPGP
jgi:hypothetical protein